jgi:SAM-dependent methyltransferase
MLDKVRVEAGRRGLDFVETEEADITALPFEDGAFDVVVTYNGLHCVPDPAGAVMEMARVLRPGGELRGCLVVTKTGFVPDTFIGLWRRTQILDVVVPADDFLGWLAAAGLEIVTTARSGAVLYFDARKPDTGPAEAGAAEASAVEGAAVEAAAVEGGTTKVSTTKGTAAKSRTAKGSAAKSGAAKGGAAEGGAAEGGAAT